MYQGTTTEFNNIISGDSRTFHARMISGDVVITGFKSVKINGQANEDTNTISIGGVVSSFIEVNMDKPDAMITGKEYTLEFGLTVGEEVEWVPVGVFTPQKPTESDGAISFTAYDRMVSKLSGPYFTNITSYPIDGKIILQEIATQTGIIIGNLDELPDGVMVSMRTQIGDEGTTTANPFDGYTHREAVKYLAQMYGKFATFNRTGELELRWYTEYEFSTNRLYAEPESSELVYTLQKITCTAGENTLTSGSGTTGISIENPVMTQEILDSVFAEIGGMEYLPTTTSFFGDIRLDLGDIITVQGRTGTERKIPIMSLSVDFDGGITTGVGSYGNTEAEENLPKGPVATALDRVYTDLFLVREVLANKVSTKVLEAEYATIKQLDAVSARIDKITSTEITVEYLEANYVKADIESVKNLFVNVGLIKDATIVDGKITGYLDAVSVNANNITAGTLAVDRLLIKDENGNYKMASYNDSGELIASTIDGSVITERTITADHIVAGAITANEIASGTITADKVDIANLSAEVAKVIELDAGRLTSGYIDATRIKAKSITADKIDVNNLFAQNITATGSITGAKLYGSHIEATSGKIGELSLANGILSHTYGNYTVCLRGVQSNLGYGVFWIQDASSGTVTYPFRVNGDGSFSATKAAITGNIKADTITITGALNMVCSSYSEIAYPAIKRYQKGSTVETEICGYNGEIMMSHNSEGVGTVVPTALWAKSIYENNVALSSKYQAKGSYAASSHTHSYLPLSGGNLTGNLTVNKSSSTATAEALVLNKNNNVSLHTNTHAGIYHYNTTGYATGGWLVYITTAGAIKMNTTSDRRLKNHVADLSTEEATCLLQELNPILFTYKGNSEDASRDIACGFYAQDVRDTLAKHNIGYRSFLLIHNNNGDGDVYDLHANEETVNYGLDYSKMVPVLWKGWQTHQESIDILEERIANLEAENTALKQKIEALAA